MPARPGAAGSIDTEAANGQTPRLMPRPPSSSTKVCQKCKVRKQRADFVVDVGNAEGPKVSLFCETCRTTLRTCLKCGIDKPVCEFTHQSNRYGHCKACYAEGRRNVFARLADLERARRPGVPIVSYYDQDPDEVLNRPKRRRAERLRAAPRERIDREAIFERDGWICGICGLVVKPEEATLDHIVPVALGGAHTAANLRLAHAMCNSRRQADTPSFLFPSGWRPRPK
jgi:HNH endonuclease